MAPAKNPNQQKNKNIPQNVNGIFNASNELNNSSNGSSSRKETGTVPKTSKTSSKKLQQQPTTSTNPLNIVASMPQQQQQTRQQTNHKNTEVVAPIRREYMKDLNDYLLNTVDNNTNQSSNITAPASANSDLENFQENQQRFCYPVRPIPRRNQQQNIQQTQNDFLNSTNNLNTNLNTSIGQIGVVIPTGATNNTAATNASNPTPDSSILNPQLQQQIQLLVLQRLKELFENSQSAPFLNLTANLLPAIQSSSSSALANTALNHTNEFNQLAQRFQQTLNLSTSSNNNTTRRNIENIPLTQQKLLNSNNMVHEVNPTACNSNEVVMNSASLEDVAMSEIGDRAQSVQSLHSTLETPTPDTTPSYEELQQRLEASNRNIQNMQEQQQQLLKLQNAAKQHLSDMEKLRQQATGLSFPSGSNGDGAAPDYQSVGQIHSDMASLVGRMKNLTSFIQNQNELSALMGDDGPEILAEQEALQKKLESLRNQRDEMRNLVSELQDVNRSAEESAKEARQRQCEQEKDVVEPKLEPPTLNKKPANAERKIPLEYSRNVPIELTQHAQRQQTNGNLQSESEAEAEEERQEDEEEEDEEQRKLTAALIQQKVVDIEAMKSQLKRLKDMMETVNLIEAHTAKDPKAIGRPTAAREVPITFNDREQTPVPGGNNYNVNDCDDNDDNNRDDHIYRKYRMLNEVTSDLRAQAISLQAEKNRIHALKAEIEKRQNQAAAAAQMGEDALKRNSLTPTPTPVSSRTHEERWDEHLKAQTERDQLKAEYDVKKKEFELLCKRLDQEDDGSKVTTTKTRQEIASEADDEAEEDNIDSDYAESCKFVPTSTPASTATTTNVRQEKPRVQNDCANKQLGNTKETLNSTALSSNTVNNIAQAANSTIDGASLEAASMQSGSSRSYSIPPPMSAMGLNFPGPNTSWNPHQYYYTAPPPPPPTHAASQANFGINLTAANTAAAAGHITTTTEQCICSANNLGATASSTASAATNAISKDPTLQQFIQTQQMLINSVCQCNQMLWHQQREIDNLNQTIHLLQERLIAITSGNMASAANVEMAAAYTLRSESVPPQASLNMQQNAAAALPNNLYVDINRAQSEQPTHYMPLHNRNSAFSNYQQQQHVYRHRLQQHHPAAGSAPQHVFNYATETQSQHNASSTATAAMYSTLNNAVAPPAATAAPPPTHYNNEIPIPQSPPAPIFMHHHNNSIHQNNANLRTQNLQQQHHVQHPHSNLAAQGNTGAGGGGNTLNNQVPPGNRANNYWDNFRSYSRQNLLSTNSNKSNEEQQEQCAAFPRSTVSMLQTQQQHPSTQLYQQQQQQQNPNHEDECSNNLNYVSNDASAESKYLRIMQRSRINQQQQYQQNFYQQQRDFLQQLTWLEQQQAHQHHHNINTATTSSNADQLMYNNYNIHQTNKVTPKQNWRNRNVEYGFQLQHGSAEPNLNALPRYQNVQNSFEQQQQQHSLAGAANGHHPMNLPRNPDFSLRILNIENENEPNYNFSSSQEQQQHQTAPLDYSNSNHQQQQNSYQTIEDDEDDDDEDDDTTSEEIKRNLLVNAFKNDKFTTKFYESIKEDVFRRLESILLDKDNAASASAAAAAQTDQPNQQHQLFNDISSISLRKLNLNEQRNQQAAIDLNGNNDDEKSEEMGSRNNQEISYENDNVTENDKAEEDTNWQQNELRKNYAVSSPVMTTATMSLGNTKTKSVNTTSNAKNIKKRKNQRRQVSSSTHNISNTVAPTVLNEEQDNNDSLSGACSLAAQHQHLQQQENKDKKNYRTSSSASSTATTASAELQNAALLHSNEYDIIKYIISRIRSQWNSNTLINDTLLVEVAKLTATVAQNSNNISPKKIYSKIKKLQLPKERDEFLVWYQNYLENTVFSGNNRIPKVKSSASSANTPHSSSIVGAVGLQQEQLNIAPPANDDGDLAEADQSGGGNLYLQAEDNQNNSLIMIKTEMDDIENNENPIDAIEQNSNSQSEGACALVTSTNNQTEDSNTNPNELKYENDFQKEN